MARPEILDVTPLQASALAGELLRVRVRNARPKVEIALARRALQPLARQEEGGDSIFWLPLPPMLEEDGVS